MAFRGDSGRPQQPKRQPTPTQFGALKKTTRPPMFHDHPRSIQPGWCRGTSSSILGCDPKKGSQAPGLVGSLGSCDNRHRGAGPSTGARSSPSAPSAGPSPCVVVGARHWAPAGRSEGCDCEVGGGEGREGLRRKVSKLKERRQICNMSVFCMVSTHVQRRAGRGVKGGEAL